MWTVVVEINNYIGSIIWKAAEEKKHGAEVCRVFVVNDTSCFSGDQDGGLKVELGSPVYV